MNKIILIALIFLILPCVFSAEIFFKDLDIPIQEINDSDGIYFNLGFDKIIDSVIQNEKEFNHRFSNKNSAEFMGNLIQSQEKIKTNWEESNYEKYDICQNNYLPINYKSCISLTNEYPEKQTIATYALIEKEFLDISETKEETETFSMNLNKRKNFVIEKGMFYEFNANMSFDAEYTGNINFECPFSRPYSISGKTQDKCFEIGSEFIGYAKENLEIEIFINQPLNKNNSEGVIDFDKKYSEKLKKDFQVNFHKTNNIMGLSNAKAYYDTHFTENENLLTKTDNDIILEIQNKKRLANLSEFIEDRLVVRTEFAKLKLYSDFIIYLIPEQTLELKQIGEYYYNQPENDSYYLSFHRDYLGADNGDTLINTSIKKANYKLFFPDKTNEINTNAIAKGKLLYCNKTYSNSTIDENYTDIEECIFWMENKETKYDENPLIYNITDDIDESWDDTKLLVYYDVEKYGLYEKYLTAQTINKGLKLSSTVNTNTFDRYLKPMESEEKNKIEGNDSISNAILITNKEGVYFNPSLSWNIEIFNNENTTAKVKIYSEYKNSANNYLIEEIELKPGQTEQRQYIVPLYNNPDYEPGLISDNKITLKSHIYAIGSSQEVITKEIDSKSIIALSSIHTYQKYMTIFDYVVNLGIERKIGFTFANIEGKEAFVIGWLDAKSKSQSGKECEIEEDTVGYVKEGNYFESEYFLAKYFNSDYFVPEKETCIAQINNGTEIYEVAVNLGTGGEDDYENYQYIDSLINYFFSYAGADTIFSSKNSNIIFGGYGNDNIIGSSEIDIVNGGKGMTM